MRRYSVCFVLCLGLSLLMTVPGYAAGNAASAGNETAAASQAAVPAASMKGTDTQSENRIVKQEGTVLYTGPGPDFTPVPDSSVPNGTKLNIIEKKTAADGTDWGYTQYNGIGGWIPYAATETESASTDDLESMHFLRIDSAGHVLDENGNRIIDKMNGDASGTASEQAEPAPGNAAGTGESAENGGPLASEGSGEPAPIREGESGSPSEDKEADESSAKSTEEASEESREEDEEKESKPDPSEKGSFPLALILAAVIGGIAAGALIMFFLGIILGRKKEKAKKQKEEDSAAEASRDASEKAEKGGRRRGLKLKFPKLKLPKLKIPKRASRKKGKTEDQA